MEFTSTCTPSQGLFLFLIFSDYLTKGISKGLFKLLCSIIKTTEVLSLGAE